LWQKRREKVQAVDPTLTWKFIFCFDKIDHASGYPGVNSQVNYQQAIASTSNFI
jgi:hypothetical protein